MNLLAARDYLAFLVYLIIVPPHEYLIYRKNRKAVTGTKDRLLAGNYWWAGPSVLRQKMEIKKFQNFNL